MDDILTVEKLKDHIKKGCQDVDDGTASEAAVCLHNLGLRRTSYLSKAKEQDLTGAGLNIFEARAVLEAWKPVGEDESISKTISLIIITVKAE